MSDYDQIDQGLKGLSRLTASSQASISFDAVWERAGQLQAKHEARQRSAMFAALYMVSDETTGGSDPGDAEAELHAPG